MTVPRFAVFVLLAVCTNAAATDVVHYANFTKGIDKHAVVDLSRAWDSGAGAIELDVHVSSDNIAYLFHESQTKPTMIKSMTHAELVDFVRYNVATLEDVLADSTVNGEIVFDLKEKRLSRIRAAIEIILASDLPPEKIVLQSNDIEVLRFIEGLDTKATLSYVTPLKWNFPFIVRPSPKRLVEHIRGVKIERVSLKGRVFINRKFVRTFKKAGYDVHVWKINPAFRVAHYLSLGADGIITGKPMQVLREVDAFAERSIPNPHIKVVPLARYAMKHWPRHGHEEFLLGMNAGSIRYGDIYRHPHLPLTSVFIECMKHKIIGVVMAVQVDISPDDFDSNLAWRNTVRSTTIRYYWNHSAFPDEDLRHVSREQVTPTALSSIISDGLRIRGKDRVDGTLSLRVTADDKDIYSTSYRLVGCPRN